MYLCTVLNLTSWRRVIKFGAIFKHANKLDQHFKEICLENSLHESDFCKPSAVVMVRWYSFYESALSTLKLWQYFLIFLDHPETKGEKVKELLKLCGDNKNHHNMCVKLVILVGALQPIHNPQKFARIRRASYSQDESHCYHESPNRDYQVFGRLHSWWWGYFTP